MSDVNSLLTEQTVGAQQCSPHVGKCVQRACVGKVYLLTSVRVLLVASFASHRIASFRPLHPAYPTGDTSTPTLQLYVYALSLVISRKHGELVSFALSSS